VYNYNGAQWYEQYRPGFDLARFVFVVMMLIVKMFVKPAFFTLPFSELSLVGLALDLVD